MGRIHGEQDKTCQANYTNKFRSAPVMIRVNLKVRSGLKSREEESLRAITVV